MEWAKKRAHPTWDLAGSNLLHCTIDELAGARDALMIGASNDDGYQPLVEAIAREYRVQPNQVASATGTSGANFLVLAALVSAGDDVLVERPGYDPLIGAAHLLGARTVRFERRYEDGFALNPRSRRHGHDPGHASHRHHQPAQPERRHRVARRAA